MKYSTQELRKEVRMIEKEVLMEYDSDSSAQKSSAVSIPLGIFNSRKLGVLEATVKYLKEEKGLSFKEMGLILSKDNRMLWSSYSQAKKKYPKKFSPKLFEQLVPVECFSGDELSCFESIIVHLKDEYGYSYSRLSKIFNRNYQTIWTTYNRAKNKVA